MDVEKQVEYWTSGSAEDFAAAQSLLEKGHLRHALFFAHLALEKMLKALVTQRTNDVAPRTHSLPRLATLAALRLDPERADFLRECGPYQIEGRYPDSENVAISAQSARGELRGAGEMLQWLKAQLST